MLKYYLIDVGLKISFQGVIQHNKYIKHFSQHNNVHTLKRLKLKLPN